MLPVQDFREISRIYSLHMWAVFILKWCLDKDWNTEKF